MLETSLIRQVLDAFGVQPHAIESLGNAGGFSGSQIFKVAAADQTYCLKRWPASTDIQKLRWIHRVLVFAAANGCRALTTPRPTRRGTTLYADARGFWELTGWARGQANYLAQPCPAKLDSAIRFLAQFHQAAARFHFNFAASENVVMAIERLNQFDAIVAAAKRSRSTEYSASFQQINEFAGEGRHLATKLAGQLDEFRDLRLPSHPVIRDIRAEHLYFEGDQLSSVIDFGAMRIDSVACDLSRMLGDCCRGDKRKMKQALDIYHSLRPLSDSERELVPILDRTSVVVGLLNWMDWLGQQQRHFDDPAQVHSRVNSLFQRFVSIASEMH